MVSDSIIGTLRGPQVSGQGPLRGIDSPNDVECYGDGKGDGAARVAMEGICIS